MAEAAAAPSAGGTAAPSAPGASGAQPATGPGDAAVPAAPPAPDAARVAKPLKPIPSLPGVFPDDDPFPSSPAPPADSPTPPGDKLRGPDGRFVASTSPAAATAGEPASERSDTSTADEPFPFAGETYKSRAAAEQNIRTLRGNFKPVMGLAKHLGGVDRIVPQFREAAESARGWKAEHDRVKAELDAYRAGKAPAAANTNARTTPDEPAAEADGIDWELYAEVRKLANESGEPHKADQWLIEQVRKSERSRTDRLLEEKFAPLTAAQRKMQTHAKTVELFEGLTAYTNEDGSPAFPELNDADAAGEIGRIWASLGLPPEAALTPGGAIAAIGVYRMRRPAAQARTTSVAAPSTPAPPAAPTDAHAASDLAGGRPTVASVPGNGATVSAEAARILAGLRSVNTGSRAHLGFDP